MAFPIKVHEEMIDDRSYDKTIFSIMIYDMIPTLELHPVVVISRLQMEVDNRFH